MKLTVCTVRDIKAESFGTPFYVPALGIAIRSLTDEVNKNENSQLRNHSGDFDLYELGLYDDANGQHLLYEVPKLILNASTLKDVNN